MGDSATLLLGLLLFLAIPIVAVSVAARLRRASSPQHSGAHFPDPWGTAVPQEPNVVSPRSRAEGEQGISPGYYPDPSYVAGRRYWDGTKWTKATQGRRR
jgi:hypothetical protein